MHFTITFALAAGVAGVLYGLYLMAWVLRHEAGSQEMHRTTAAIQEGARTYLLRQFSTVGAVAAVLFALLWAAGRWAEPFGLLTAVGFLVGAGASALAGVIGMQLSVRANVLTAQAARHGLASAFQVAFRGGAVTGMLLISLALLAVTGFYAVSVALAGPARALHALLALGFGGSLISVFARVGGGIYTKAADVGADLFETYAVTTIAAMVLGAHLFPGAKAPVLYPLLLGAVAVLTTIAGTFFVRLGPRGRIMMGLYKGIVATGCLSALLFYPATLRVMDGVGGVSGLAYYCAAVIGLIISGLAVGMQATVLPILVIGGSLWLSHWFAGLYGIAVAATAMLSMAGMVVAIDAFGPISDHAGGIAEKTQPGRRSTR